MTRTIAFMLDRNPAPRLVVVFEDESTQDARRQDARRTRLDRVERRSDVVVLDVMPVLDGWAVLEMPREQGAGPQVLVVSAILAPF